MLPEIQFDETSQPVKTVPFDYASVEQAVDGVDHDQAPRDVRRQRLIAFLGLVFAGAEPKLAQARLAQLDQLLNPTLRPHDARLKWPRLRKNLQDQVARELASLTDPEAKKKPVAGCTATGSPKIENLFVQGLNEK